VAKWLDGSRCRLVGRISTRPKRHCVTWGPSSPIPKAPNFRPMFIVAKRLDGSRQHLAWRWASVQAILCEMGTHLPSPKGGTVPKFSAHFYFGQTAGCIKMPLGIELGLGPRHIVLDGDPAPPQKGHIPNFRPMSIVDKRLDGSIDATWYGGRPRPRRRCVR